MSGNIMREAFINPDVTTFGLIRINQIGHGCNHRILYTADLEAKEMAQKYIYYELLIIRLSFLNPIGFQYLLICVSGRLQGTESQVGFPGTSVRSISHPPTSP